MAPNAYSGAAAPVLLIRQKSHPRESIGQMRALYVYTGCRHSREPSQPVHSCAHVHVHVAGAPTQARCRLSCGPTKKGRPCRLGWLPFQAKCFRRSWPPAWVSSPARPSSGRGCPACTMTASAHAEGCPPQLCRPSRHPRAHHHSPDVTTPALSLACAVLQHIYGAGTAEQRALCMRQGQAAAAPPASSLSLRAPCSPVRACTGEYASRWQTMLLGARAP